MAEVLSAIKWQDACIERLEDAPHENQPAFDDRCCCATSSRRSGKPRVKKKRSKELTVGLRG